MKQPAPSFGAAMVSLALIAAACSGSLETGGNLETPVAPDGHVFIDDDRCGAWLDDDGDAGHSAGTIDNQSAFAVDVSFTVQFRSKTFQIAIIGTAAPKPEYYTGSLFVSRTVPAETQASWWEISPPWQIEGFAIDCMFENISVMKSGSQEAVDWTGPLEDQFRKYNMYFQVDRSLSQPHFSCVGVACQSGSDDDPAGTFYR